MTTSRRRARPLPLQMAELAIAAPQVVAHRLTRMALAGPNPNARDSKEFKLMSAEKTAAFSESWSAMFMQTALAQQKFALSMMRTSMLWPLGLARKPSVDSALAQLTRAGMGVLAHGITPVNRRAVANAKRLRTTRLK
jgi:hypothetical protein